MTSAPPITDLEARARWHLQMIGIDSDPVVIDERDYDEDGQDGVTCWKCGGEGFELVCIDDLCHGMGYCMHGDGHVTCSECNGEVSL